MNVNHIQKSKPSQSVQTISPNARIREAVEALGRLGIGALVVSADSRAIDGILSERDIVRGLSKNAAGCLDQKVSELMTRDVQSCEPGEAVNSVMVRMTKGRFRHMPVVENNGLAGIISIGDVVKARMSEIEHENQALTDLIAGYA